tara:strand:- start:6874 stop:8145 length:1272 start_codon:yes stop_codon:yes gene_type:complete
MNSPYSKNKLPSINSSYKEISLLGKGTYGSVYLVKDVDKGIYYADKRIRLIGRDLYEKNSILNEIRLLACHRSPYIIQLYDVYITNNILHLITEYAAKGDLSKIIKRYRRTGKYFSEEHIKTYLFQICNGIQYLHQNNIMHRDIKSANIFMTKKRNIKIGDVGIIKVLSPSVDYTRTKIGTPYYMSPELYKHQKYNSKTDVWSIGVLLYELMTLKLPFNANNMDQLKYKIANENWYLEDKYKHKFSSGLCDILYKLLQSNPKDRYSLTEVLSHSYFKNMQDDHINKQLSFEPLFYAKPAIPYNVRDWNKAINKYTKSNNKPLQIDPLPIRESKNKNEVSSLINPVSNIKIPPLVYNTPIADLNKGCMNKYKLLELGNEAGNLIKKLERLVEHISAYRYQDYYSLKQEIKSDIKKYKNVLSSYS